MASKRCFGIFFFLLFLIIIGVTIICIIAKDGIKHQETYPFWQRTIVYQVYPRSFCDHDGDGTGDLQGILSKADYLKELGVGTVWLSPIFSSPMADFGYDVSNFTAVEPLFGTMDDFDALRAALHDRGEPAAGVGLRAEPSSDEHEWFVKSRRREEPYTDYYIWADPKGFDEAGQPIPPNNWLSVFRGSAWAWAEERQQFYFHQFLAKQPDLNYRNQRVREEMMQVLRFWLDRGADGFRVDAVKFLFEVEDINQNESIAIDPETDDPLDYYYLNHTLTINQPETLEVVREWRDILDQYSDRVMIGNEGTIDDDIASGDELLRQRQRFPLERLSPFNFLLIDRFHNRKRL
ncbi:hypothetical protein C7M84_010198 [Penaeus vannamei]|uniref:alpha-glucosidase n=1 Tax=Penaeus vannamei TaxID=6689 RepID=A0A3R7M490_PENVA|nr:hypothetical protein C7M84_010198 [Penaeus vannamei]